MHGAFRLNASYISFALAKSLTTDRFTTAAKQLNNE
jgi:hypothetical protein